MNPRIIFRVIVFFATIMLLVALIAWTALTSWQRMGELQAHLKAQQWNSLDIGTHLQQTILGLNNLVVRYAASRNETEWTNFDATSRELGQWISTQQPLSSSPEERALLSQIQAAYSNYLAAAELIHTRIYGTRVTLFRLIELTDFENQSKRILDFGSQLARVHQRSLDDFQKQTTQSLNILGFTLLGALILLLGAGAWLSAVVYQDLIAPLKVQLVESRQLLERQEKLASLGMLAAGVAHEIRNPLTAIKAWLYMQQKRLKPGTPEHEDANLISRRNQPPRTDCPRLPAIRPTLRAADRRRPGRPNSARSSEALWSRASKRTTSNWRSTARQPRPSALTRGKSNRC